MPHPLRQNFIQVFFLFHLKWNLWVCYGVWTHPLWTFCSSFICDVSHIILADMFEILRESAPRLLDILFAPIYTSLWIGSHHRLIVLRIREIDQLRISMGTFITTTSHSYEYRFLCCQLQNWSYIGSNIELNLSRFETQRQHYVCLN